MIALLLALLLNTYIGIVFKWFEKYNVSVLQAIVINYVTCVITGSIFYGKMPYSAQALNPTVTSVAIIMGVFYFLVFMSIARCTLIFGISTTQIANKLSLIIPVIMAMILIGEEISIIKWVGIFLAMYSVWYASAKNSQIKGGSILLPVFIFLGSGFLDAVTNHVQRFLIQNSNEQAVYIIYCFSSAFLFSSIYLLNQIRLRKEVLNLRSVIGGIILGIPNYFSLYYLMEALHSNLLPTSAMIPIINIGVVFLSSIASVLFFKDKLSQRQYVGLGLSALAILLILFGDV